MRGKSCLFISVRSLTLLQSRCDIQVGRKSCLLMLMGVRFLSFLRSSVRTRLLSCASWLMYSIRHRPKGLHSFEPMWRRVEPEWKGWELWSIKGGPLHWIKHYEKRWHHRTLPDLKSGLHCMNYAGADSWGFRSLWMQKVVFSKCFMYV
jgi:hypothetical protein